MCGIFGFVGREGSAGYPVEKVKQVLRHRGPDAQQARTFDGACLVHTRLSIIDLSEAGCQPMTNEDESLWIVFNGEIYNAPELRKGLLKRGHRFRSDTDTEVLLHLYEDHGAAMPKLLRGMFAFGIYDVNRRELFAARDPFGIKPFFYAGMSGSFGFSSELRGLLALPDFPREMDWDAFALYSRLMYIPAPRTIWKAARRLEPGHSLTVRDGRVVAKDRYFHLRSEPFQGSLEEAIDTLDATLRDSVRAHLLADVPVGAFLSGGLDSSVIAAMAQAEMNQPLSTFTITFPEVRTHDESGYARQVAEHIGSNHHEIAVSSGEASAAILEVVDHLDEPFADSSLVPTSIVSKVTRRHVKVALSGDGGDEFFGGYYKYVGLRLAERLNLLRPFVRAAAALPLPEGRGGNFAGRWRQFRRLGHIMAADPFDRYARAVQLLSEDLHATVRSDVRARRRGMDGLAAAALREVWDDAEAHGHRGENRWLYGDTLFALPYDMLHKVDVASMLHSLEVRPPLVDPLVGRFAFSLPFEWKLRGNRRKWILEQVAARYIPASVIDRPKQGFIIPFDEWIRTDLRDTFREALAPERLAESGIWDAPRVTALLDEHMSRRKDRSLEIWNVLVFERWRRKWNPIL